MTLEQAISEKVRSLPLEKQQEILNFVEFLMQKSQAIGFIKIPEQSERLLADFYGICADDPIVIEDREILDLLDDEMEGVFD